MTLEYDLEDSQDLRDDVDEEPLVSSGWASHGDYVLVGQSPATSKFCGTFLHLKGCPRVDLHRIRTLDGVNYTNKIYLRKIHSWCNKPSCKICFKKGWAVREAERIEARLKSLSVKFGEPEHIVVSVPSRDYDMDFVELRRKSYEVVKKRGVLGGVMIFHGFRFNTSRYWYFSAHWHCIGFIRGGFRKCRRCRSPVCMGEGNFLKCDGFEARTRRIFQKDGYIVKVLAKRKTIFGTAWYQLNHASIKVGVKRFHVATWFGVASYVKAKVEAVKNKVVCPICQHDLVRLRYNGVKHFETDRLAVGFIQDSFEDYLEDGRCVWVEVQPKVYRSGNYED